MRALAYAELQEFDVAMVDFAKAIALAPDNHRPIYERGRLNAELGEHNNAISDFTESLKRTQDQKIQACILLDRGRSYSKSDMSNNTADVHYMALEDFREALRLDDPPENLHLSDLEIPALLLAMSEPSPRSMTSWFKAKLNRLIGK